MAVCGCTPCGKNCPIEAKQPLLQNPLVMLMLMNADIERRRLCLAINLHENRDAGVPFDGIMSGALVK